MESCSKAESTVYNFSFNLPYGILLDDSVSVSVAQSSANTQMNIFLIFAKGLIQTILFV